VYRNVISLGLVSHRKKKKKEAVVQIRNDHLLFPNASFTRSGWLVSPPSPRTDGAAMGSQAWSCPTRFSV